MKSLLLSALLVAAAPLAHADGFTYAQFEISVNHIDLESCPEGLASGDVFCRATILHDSVHIYVFEKEGDMAFVNMVTFDEGSYDVTLRQ